MAFTTAEAREHVASLFIAYLGRAPEYQAMDFYIGQLNKYVAQSDGNVGDALLTLSAEIYHNAGGAGEIPVGPNVTNAEFVTWTYQNVLGREPDAEGLAYYVALLEEGTLTREVFVHGFLDNVRGQEAGTRDYDYVANRVEVAVEFSKWANSNPSVLDSLTYNSKQVLEGVNETEASVEAALGKIAANAGGGSTGTTLTVGVDNLIGTEGDDVFTAPLAQNALGAVTNTLESGDSIDGGGGRDKLIADLTYTVSGTQPIGPAISPTLVNIEEVYLRAQTPNVDLFQNINTIDAQNASGVEQWWSLDSRSTISIEDIRSRPENTIFGMRNTDSIGNDFDNTAAGPSLIALFDPAQLTTSIDLSDSSLTLVLVNADSPASELESFPVNGFAFLLNGEQYLVQSDEIAAANTYAELAAAVEAALAEDEALAGLTISVNANGITLTDPAGGTFAPVGYTWVDNIAPPAGALQWNQVVGAPEQEERPIETTLVVDHVGRSEQGGIAVIGSFANVGGVDNINVLVQGSSWLSLVDSTNNHLDTVTVAHDEGYSSSYFYLGDNTLSNGGAGQFERPTTVDNRLNWGEFDPITGELDYYAGLRDVRVLDATGFQGELKVAAGLYDTAIDKYLRDATEPVQFSYLLGNGGSNLSIHVDNDLSDDPDFRLEIVGGAGNDRINLDGAAIKSGISIDGGEGQNILEVTTSTGTNADNTFASVENIQTLVVAGDDDTTQNIINGNLLGVEEVVIQTVDSANTTLVNLNAELDVVTINGANQTLPAGQSDNDQEFGLITVQNAAAAELSVVLENTARLEGELSVEGLTITGNNSAVRTLNLVSSGQRDTANIVADIDAARVTELNLLGTQDLAVEVVNIGKNANSQGVAFTIDASELGGTVLVDLEAANVNATNGRDLNVVLTGAAGDEDVLVMSGELAVTERTTISAFETLVFTDDASGVFNATNVSGVELYVIDELDGDIEVNNLGNVEAFLITDAHDGNDITIAAAGRAADSQVTITFDPFDDAGNLGATYNGELTIENYRTITLDFESVGNQSVVTEFDLYLPGWEFGTDDDRVNHARTLEITGGAWNGTVGNADELTLEDLSLSLTAIDVSQFVGNFTGSFALPVDADGAFPGDLDWTPTNTVITVGGFALDFDITEAANVITTFRFTQDALHEDFDWTIDGFNAFDAGGVTLSNVTVLDLRELGITGLADLSITDDGTDTFITSNDGVLDFEIVLLGVNDSEDLGNENFIFAA